MPPLPLRVRCSRVGSRCLPLRPWDNPLSTLSVYVPSMLCSLGSNTKDYRFRQTLLPHIDTALQGSTDAVLDVTARLGPVYVDGGQWKEAAKLHVLVMETRKQVLCKEHPDTLISMGNLALTYQNQGRWKEAKVLDVSVMEMRKQVLGKEHPNTLTSMC